VPVRNGVKTLKNSLNYVISPPGAASGLAGCLANGHAAAKTDEEPSVGRVTLSLA